MKTIPHALCAALVAAGLGGAQAATVSLYGTRAEFVTALGGAPTLTQDFEAYAAGTDLVGVQVLPSVTMSTNLANLKVFNSAGLGKFAFATNRDQPEANYDIQLAGGYKAFGFDITAYNPATPGPGFLSVFFADGDLTYTLIPVLPLNATEDDPIFFGVMSDVAITGVRWSEGPELDGFSCCEETGLDNLIVAGRDNGRVPEPASGWMVVSALAGAGWATRRRQRRSTAPSA
jgi:hypothetical protein